MSNQSSQDLGYIGVVSDRDLHTSGDPAATGHGSGSASGSGDRVDSAATGGDALPVTNTAVPATADTTSLAGLSDSTVFVANASALASTPVGPLAVQSMGGNSVTATATSSLDLSDLSSSDFFQPPPALFSTDDPQVAVFDANPPIVHDYVPESAADVTDQPATDQPSGDPAAYMGFGDRDRALYDRAMTHAPNYRRRQVTPMPVYEIKSDGEEEDLSAQPVLSHEPILERQSSEIRDAIPAVRATRASESDSGDSDGSSGGDEDEEDEDGFLHIPDQLDKPDHLLTHLEQMQKAKIVLQNRKKMLRRQLSDKIRRYGKEIAALESKLMEVPRPCERCAERERSEKTAAQPCQPPASTSESGAAVDPAADAATATDAATQPTGPPPTGMDMQARIEEALKQQDAQVLQQTESRIKELEDAKTPLPNPEAYTKKTVQFEFKQLDAFLPKRKDKTVNRYLLFICTVPKDHDGKQVYCLKSSEYLSIYHFGAFRTEKEAHNCAMRVAKSGLVKLTDFVVLPAGKLMVLPPINLMNRITFNDPELQKFVDGHMQAMKREERKHIEATLREHAANKTRREFNVHKRARELQTQKAEAKVTEQQHDYTAVATGASAADPIPLKIEPVTDPAELDMLRARAKPVKNGDQLTK